MKITQVERPPRGVSFTQDDEHGGDLSEKDVEAIVEIFQTPLTCHYNWDYQSADGRIRKLYELGKSMNWNASEDIDWDRDFPQDQMPLDQDFNPFVGWPPYDSMSEEDKLRFSWHNLSWTLAQFMHGEQGALLVASQLCSCAPTYDGKLYAASQTFDEARHVEVFTKYIKEKLKIVYPINDNLKALLDKILTDPRWDLKFIGMQVIVEGLALAAFKMLRSTASDPLLKDLIYLVIRDEARHVTFGINYLEDFCKTLTQEEKEDRAQFAYEACVVMRERLIATDVYAEFGWDVEAARQRVLDAEVMQLFRNLLFERIVPNLSRIGLLTESIRPKFEALGILEFEKLGSDADIDWAELEKPLYRDSAESEQQLTVTSE